MTKNYAGIRSMKEKQTVTTQTYIAKNTLDAAIARSAQQAELIANLEQKSNDMKQQIAKLHRDSVEQSNKISCDCAIELLDLGYIKEPEEMLLRAISWNSMEALELYVGNMEQAKFTGYKKLTPLYQAKVEYLMRKRNIQQSH
ncbi:MAG: hypothetical protein V2I33_14450 [Kangiellaceae bacterium]|jgi:gamma-glutamyl:cysteine ligase YbdK (ATP-grasp superfamily)|nr:hypothetical protein [Kangiellaceae bacterium]